MVGGAARAASPDFADTIQAIIHAWVPHSSAVLDFFSFATVIIVAAIAGIYQWATGRGWPAQQFMRIGFASAPLPVYFFLPLLPWDHDLAQMFMEERLLLALAAICGFLWTIREIANLFAEERREPPPANS